ncbi:hypothetical protein BraRD5C2_03740 [Bradyrhizobium sp. RD5-C2]|nr:hypothetical protein BraRD5C2_03740 [Bradyrhizobium sp. RD5-C2]
MAALIIRKERTTSEVGSIGVRPVSTTKVRKPDNSAIATANGASQRRSGKPRASTLGSAGDACNVEAVVSALVIPAIELKAIARGNCELMQSYHNVAELRHFRGANRGAAPCPSKPFVTTQ